MAAKQGQWPVNTKLRAQVEDLLKEIENLQCALNFWLPCVPEGTDGGPVVDRIFNDAALLAGYNGPMVETAEELGWVVVRDPSIQPSATVTK